MLWICWLIKKVVTVLSMNSGMKIWFEIWTQNLLWNIRYCELWLCVSTNNDESNVWMLSYLFFFFLIFADFKSVLSFVVIGMKERWENSNFCCTKKKQLLLLLAVTRLSLEQHSCMIYFYFIFCYLLSGIYIITHTHVLFF